MTDRVCICVRNEDGKLLAPRDPNCPVHASSNRAPTPRIGESCGICLQPWTVDHDCHTTRNREAAHTIVTLAFQMQGARRPGVVANHLLDALESAGFEIVSRT